MKSTKTRTLLYLLLLGCCILTVHGKASISASAAEHSEAVVSEATISGNTTQPYCDLENPK